jgi:hypothetical protein
MLERVDVGCNRKEWYEIGGCIERGVVTRCSICATEFAKSGDGKIRRSPFWVIRLTFLFRTLKG